MHKPKKIHRVPFAMMVKKMSKALTFLSLSCWLFLLVPISTFLDMTLYAYASSCSLSLTEPTLLSVSSSKLIEPAAGEQFIIATTITNVCSGDQPFFGIIEVRNSEEVTEYLGWQSGTLEPDGIVEIGVSWVPEHADNYELRAFAISDLLKPDILSKVLTTNSGIVNAQTPFIVIKSDSDGQTIFEPDFLRVILGVNSTIKWANADTISHRLIGDKTRPFSEPLDFNRDVFIYPGQSLVYSFATTGVFEYHDQAIPGLGAFIQVFPSDSIDANLEISIEGLKHDYLLAEPVQFTVNMKGYETGCGTFDVLVDKIDASADEAPFNWKTGASFDCDVNVTFRQVNDHFPDSYWSEQPFSPPINQTGTYRVTALFDGTLAHAIVVKEFAVK